MNPFELVIFDCDGILVDSELIGNQILATILARHHVHLDADDARTQYAGLSVVEIRQRVEASFGIEMRDDWACDYYELLIEVLRTQVKPITGVKAVIEYLKQAEVPFCVASQGPVAKMEASLTSAGLWEAFAERAFSAKSVANPKPSPDVFLHAAYCLGAAPNRCAVVEDSLVGVSAALAASMTVFAYCPHGGEGTMREIGAIPFRTMQELPTLLTH